jgi:uncharacterized protein (TIGR02147 family)
MKTSQKHQTESHARMRPVEVLLRTFEQRRERNASYSVSAFARDLGVSPSLLSRVFAGSRPMTLKFALQVVEALDLKDVESNQLVLSVLQCSSKSAKISKKLRAKLEKQAGTITSTDSSEAYTALEVERFRAMANWYHLALLNLVTLDSFCARPAAIARRLGITTIEARSALDRLIATGLIKEEANGKISRTSQAFYVKTARSEFAVRKFHKQMIAKASAELDRTSDVEFSRRLINGITFACGPEHLELIKDKINRFQDEIIALTHSGSRNDVYQMNMQFFPLTKTDSIQEGEAP